MSRTGRLRNEIVVFLGKWRINTSQILGHVNSRFRWGATMNQIGNVLARDRDFKN